MKQAEAEEKGEVATTGQDMSSELPNGEAGANAEDAMEDGELEEGEAQAGETLASDGQPVYPERPRKQIFRLTIADRTYRPTLHQLYKQQQNAASQNKVLHRMKFLILWPKQV